MPGPTSTVRRCCPTCASPSPPSKAKVSLHCHRRDSIGKEASMRRLALGLLALSLLVMAASTCFARGGHGHGHGHGGGGGTSHHPD
jgi:hypothetical protein